MKVIVSIFLLLFVGSAAIAQVELTKNDYDQAVHALPSWISRYIDHGDVSPHWLPEDKFWFRDLVPTGKRFLLVNPQKKTITAAFDQQKLAKSLSKVTGKTIHPERLPFRIFHYADNGTTITFYANRKHWKCDLDSYKVTEITKDKSSGGLKSYWHNRSKVTSPNGKLKAFIKDYNLWVEVVETGEERQLTFDGVKDFGYATDNAGWTRSKRPVIRWSPDSKKIATYKQDQRKVNNMYLVDTKVGAPQLESWKYEFPLDSNIMMIHRVIIEVQQPRVIPIDVPADPRRSTHKDNIVFDGHMADVQWSSDGSKLAFVSTDRYHKSAKVRIADAATGEVREVFEERVATQFESGHGGINWRYLSKTDEIIWFSERDNWGHLYLYDVRSGTLKHKITTGHYVVDEIVKLDKKNRVIYFTANGLQKENPYFRELCKINFNGKGFKELTPEPGTHYIEFSPSERYFIDEYSKPDVPGITVLRNLDGKVLLTLTRTDISRLKQTGWKPPIPFKAKAANGKMDVYGLMFLPDKLDRNKKYPVINYIYPGPQGGTVRNWSFIPSRKDHMALASLGFIVVVINGTGNPLRTKAFQDASYGNMAINTLPDQIAGIRQLANRYPFIDTSRVGIWGHSGGGFATVRAMLKYPNFFKVGIAESGNHDNRNYESDWSDRYNGPLTEEEFAAQANETYAQNLKGKLLLVHGLMDGNVPAQNTLLVIQALEKANKSFDLIFYPSSGHSYLSNYFYEMRRRWDYFVTYLLDKKPPLNYKIKTERDPRVKIR